ncbi:hypothetical protein [Azotobacter chroococcum]|uniref:hypothetical protein n=1 Tax=Azotobacter chroococcum TaxID=353 RepID=UPI0010ADF7CA|nr:hypothetical protein [Azotobacter chroococcum]TKD30015.1 hypothetical protein FCG41_24375 [Azotobacter chroococcum]
MTEATELAVIDDITADKAPAIYVKGGLTKFLDAVKAEVESEVPDLATRKGRDRIASLAARVSKSKVAVEKPGREYLKRLKEMPKVVEEELREFVTAMDKLRDDTRRPLTEWEAAEAARVAKHETFIEMLKQTGEQVGGFSAQTLRDTIAGLELAEIGAAQEEFEAEAHRVKAASLATLREALAKQEAEQAELARLRAEASAREQKEREERIAREAAERAQREAEQRAQAEREAAARREAEAKAAAEQAKRDAEMAEQRRIEAEKRAEAERLAAAERERQAAEQARQAELDRQAEEKARLEREAAAREADKAHKAKINRAALDAFIAGGMPEACAKQAVTLIAQRKIPQITISY